MKYLLKLLFFIYIIVLSIRGDVSYLDVLVFVMIIGVTILKERFFNTRYMTLVSLIFICGGICVGQNYTFLLCIPLFDFTYEKTYLGVLPVFLLGAFEAWQSGISSLLFMMILCVILAFMIRQAEDKETDYKNRLDAERRLRYELEETKIKLLNASKDIAHLTEVSERNRIAREIHDNAGHSIAGILIQLQAANKLMEVDRQKSRMILEKSISGLSCALTLLRDTVYNIKPKETVGVKYLKSIIDNFGFCPVDFIFIGDLGVVTPSQWELLASIIKEALTNAAKHSKATNLAIVIDIDDKVLKLDIKDNGVGCDQLKEGLGLSGMKERIFNMGGTLSISSGDGFRIVSILPMTRREGCVND